MNRKHLWLIICILTATLFFTSCWRKKDTLVIPEATDSSTSPCQAVLQPSTNESGTATVYVPREVELSDEEAPFPDSTAVSPTAIPDTTYPPHAVNSSTTQETTEESPVPETTVPATSIPTDTAPVTEPTEDPVSFGNGPNSTWDDEL